MMVLKSKFWCNFGAILALRSKKSKFLVHTFDFFYSCGVLNKLTFD